jgi:ribosomal protein L11 methyltransferase
MDEWLGVSVKVNHGAVEAVADMLREAGASNNGVVIEDPVLINDLRKTANWELCDIPEQTNTEVVTITAYYPEDAKLRNKLAEIEIGLKTIEQRIGKFQFGSTLFQKISQEDWANEWKQYFHTTHIGKCLVIKPSWEEYKAKPGEKIIHIDPGMAFGTGTHHTTAMCMAELEEIVKPDSLVFDVGTGSGILAIAAALVGAKSVKAVDNDSTAVKVARENVAMNKLDQVIEVKQGDLLTGTAGKANIIVANIIANVIIVLLQDVPGKLLPGGLFLASGIIEDRVQDVEQAAEKAGMTIKKINRRGGWAAILMGKEE